MAQAEKLDAPSTRSWKKGVPLKSSWIALSPQSSIKEMRQIYEMRQIHEMKIWAPSQRWVWLALRERRRSHSQASWRSGLRAAAQSLHTRSLMGVQGARRGGSSLKRRSRGRSHSSGQSSA